MPFQKNNKEGFTSDDPLDKAPLCIRLSPGVKDRLQAIPGWRNKLRALIDQLISGQIDTLS